MQGDNKRLLVFGLIAALAGGVTVYSVRRARAQSVPTPLTVAPVAASSAGQPSHGVLHTVPAAVTAAPRQLTSSHGRCLISGIVRDASGTPVAEATVTAHPLRERDWDDDTAGDHADATTDEAGRFELEALPGDFALHAEHDTATSALLEPISLAPGESVRDVELVLTRDGRTSGIVVDQRGNPVEADIILRVAGHHSVYSLGTSDERGAFTLEPAPDAALEIVATSTENGATVTRSLAHPERDLILRLGSPLGALLVDVFDEHDERVPWATIYLVTGDSAILTNADSEGPTRVQPRSARVEIHATNGDSSSETIKLELDGSERSVRLRLSPCASVSGRVVEADGSRVRGEMRLVSTAGPNKGEETAIAVLDRAGAYHFGPVQPGSYRLIYVASWMTLPDESVALEVTIFDREAHALPDMRLSHPRTLSGVVRDEHGEPVAEASIELVDSGESSTGSADITTDEQGRFKIEQVRGPMRLRAAGDGSLSAIVLAAGTGNEEVALTLQSTGSVDGVLRGAHDKHARVRCEGGLWHAVGDTGQYHLPCAPGAALEIAAAGETRRFPIEVDEDEVTYVELRW